MTVIDVWSNLKRRPGYANFAVDDPPLKLVLVERPGHGGSLNHLGIEVPDTAAVDAGPATCCGYASDNAEDEERVDCRVTDLREPRTVN